VAFEELGEEGSVVFDTEFGGVEVVAVLEGKY
jgi:hypothetical protein